MKKLSLLGRAELGIAELFAGKCYAYVPVIAGSCIGLGIAVANEPGYSPIPTFWAWASTWAEMDAHADELNCELGLNDEAAMRIVASSMAAQSRRNAAKIIEGAFREVD